jgi:hypothetical protein
LEFISQPKEAKGGRKIQERNEKEKKDMNRQKLVFPPHMKRD